MQGTIKLTAYNNITHRIDSVKKKYWDIESRNFFIENFSASHPGVDITISIIPEQIYLNINLFKIESKKAKYNYRAAVILLFSLKTAYINNLITHKELTDSVSNTEHKPVLIDINKRMRNRYKKFKTSQNGRKQN